MKPILPEKPIDTRDGIFKRLWLCRMRQIDTFSSDYIKEMGIPSSGDLERDMESMRTPMVLYLTIKDMVYYMRQNVPFNVVNYDDTAKIYECIQDHLNAWRQEIEFSYDARYAPLEDLVDLDKLAAIVYDKARFVFNHEFIESRTLRGMGHLFENVIGLGDIFAEASTQPEKQIDDENADPHAHLPKRESLEDIFLARLS